MSVGTKDLDVSIGTRTTNRESTMRRSLLLQSASFLIEGLSRASLHSPSHHTMWIEPTHDERRMPNGWRRRRHSRHLFATLRSFSCDRQMQKALLFRRNCVVITRCYFLTEEMSNRSSSQRWSTCKWIQLVGRVSPSSHHREENEWNKSNDKFNGTSV